MNNFVSRRRGKFVSGDRVQLSGPKGSMHSFTLDSGKVFHSHRGTLPHDSIIGVDDGSVVSNDAGVPYLILRPLLQDFVMSMPRGAAIVYPKDAAHILSIADIFPGATVVEAGVGSGALSLWILRALGEKGHLFSFEKREEFAEIAVSNVTSYFGQTPENWTVTSTELSLGLSENHDDASTDRVVLDMLTPWECLPEVTRVTRPGGVVVAYVATVPQLSRMVEAFRSCEKYTEPHSSEVMVRGWHVEGLAVRPDHRMVAHTGFLVSARRLAPGFTTPQTKRRTKTVDFLDEDIEAWTPGAVGERILSEKSIRKRLNASRKTMMS